METELAFLTVTFELLAPLLRFFGCIYPSARLTGMGIACIIGHPSMEIHGVYIP